jgi:Signal peptidase, peptidase S26
VLARAPLEQRGAWERTLRTRASLHGGRAGFAAARGRLDAGWPIPVSFVGMYRAAWVIIAVAAAALLVLGGNSLAGLTTPDPTQAGELPYQQVYREPSGSMEPTLGIGTKVIVSPGAPKIGEIVVFHPPEGAIVEKGAVRHPTSSRPAARHAPNPCRDHRPSRPSSASSPGRATKSTSGKDMSSARPLDRVASYASRTLTRAPAVLAPSATFRPRSKSQQDTGTCWATNEANRRTAGSGARSRRPGSSASSRPATCPPISPD